MSESTHKPGGHLKNMILTASGTTGSRILGLVRDQLLAAFFGTGGVASAFILAFQIPNLFRRLLGEGALTTALVPVMSHERKRGGKEQAFVFLNFVLRRVAPWMFGFALFGSLFCWWLGANWQVVTGVLGFESVGDSYHALAARLTAVCMPYMPLICMAAVLTAALNMLGRFGLTSLSAVWLNIAMIGGLLFGVVLFRSDEARIYCVCIGALVGGAVQMLVPAWGLRREGWSPAMRTPACSDDAWREIRAIFIPAVIGAGVQQINLFLTRFLAFSVDERALSIYYYANRVVELPVGIFAVTVSTVIFPALAAHAAHGDKRGMAQDLGHGMRLIFAINIAAAAGLIALAEPIVRVLFQYGKFTVADTVATVPVLVVFALSIPFYAVIGLFGRALSALSETHFQMRLAWRVLALNAVCAPVLGFWLGAPGLALANLIAAVYQSLSLFAELRRRDEYLRNISVRRPLLQCLGAALVMALVAYLGVRGLDLAFGASRRVSILALAVMIPAGSLLYFAFLRKMRYPEVDELAAMAGRIRRKVGL